MEEWQQIEQLINYTKECEKKHQVEYCNKCGMIKPLCKCKPKTNADRIRSMTDEELAMYLIQLTEVVKTCDVCEPTYRENGDCDCHCENGVLRWLKMERED